MNQNPEQSELNYQTINQNQLIPNQTLVENNESNSKNESEEKRKRRTKNDNSGRTFICKLCDKSYL